VTALECRVAHGDRSVPGKQPRNLLLHVNSCGIGDVRRHDAEQRPALFVERPLLSSHSRPMRS
jgi:hypothetical protein